MFWNTVLVAVELKIWVVQWLILGSIKFSQGSHYFYSNLENMNFQKITQTWKVINIGFKENKYT
jgi:hypothetical protein